MTWKDVILAIDGLRNRDKMHEAWVRRATFIIASTNIGGKSVAAKLEKLWPVDDESKSNIPKRALEQLRKFREAAALERAKKKLDVSGS